ncbi:acetyl-CoA carboxylase biotin carboxyl carrier protein subunit [Tautonia rosea]|uniref:acetyl-CoA carboxylase biotin carboxyl carrier protein subunit n=1 Tax=Tautonia rosea TaxID=2728037 RepID=UPI001475B665|nr:acetyl-CoA carboxylase biotin carboxyl carrier protein subunit [Tautonia rosea]
MKLKITVDGNVYEVEVEVAEPETPRHSYVPPLGHARVSGAPTPATPAPASAGQALVADESKVCRSPLAGVVSRVAVQPGQAIQVNDILIVLEAMKMETVITAPIAGTIAKINAGEGDGVQQGQVLIEFE